METAQIVVEISKIVTDMIAKVEGVYFARGHVLQLSSQYLLKMITAMLTPTYIESDRRINNFSFLEYIPQSSYQQSNQAGKYLNHQSYIKQELQNSNIFIFPNQTDKNSHKSRFQKKMEFLPGQRLPNFHDNNNYYQPHKTRGSPCFFARPTPQEIEQLKNWIIEQKQDKRRLQITMIQMKAREICSNKSFKASRGWVKKIIEKNPELHKYFPKIRAKNQFEQNNSSISQHQDSFPSLKDIVNKNPSAGNQNMIRLPSSYLPRPTSQQLEKLKNWIIHESQMGNKLSIKDIQNKARNLCSSIGFKACHSWVRKFMDRTPDIHKYFPKHYSPSGSQQQVKKTTNTHKPKSFISFSDDSSSDEINFKREKSKGRQKIKIYEQSDDSSYPQKQNQQQKSESEGKESLKKMEKEAQLAHISKYCGEKDAPKFRITKHNLFNTQQEQEKQLSI